MTAPETIRRLAALAVAAAAAADRQDVSLQRAAYQRLRQEALRLNEIGGWATDESIATVLPSLGALDEIAALDAAIEAADREAGLDGTADATRVEAGLRDLAGWATGVRVACEFAQEVNDGD